MKHDFMINLPQNRYFVKLQSPGRMKFLPPFSPVPLSILDGNRVTFRRLYLLDCGKARISPLGLTGRVPAGRAVGNLRQSAGRDALFPARWGTGTGAIVAPGPACHGAGLRADRAGLGRVERSVGVATTARRGCPGAKAGVPGGSRQRRGDDRQLGQRLLRLRQPDGFADRYVVDAERVNIIGTYHVRATRSAPRPCKSAIKS